MNAVRTIIWKETRCFLRERTQLAILVSTVLFLGVFSSLRFGSSAFLITALIAVFASVYLLSWISFNGEKVNKTLASLLAAPIRVRELFLGKILAISVLTFLLELVAVTFSSLIVWLRLGELPAVPVILAALVTIPIWGITIAELLGFAYLLWGNPFIIRLVAILVIVSLVNRNFTNKIGALISSPITPIALGAAIATLLYLLSGRVDKERIT